MKKRTELLFILKKVFIIRLMSYVFVNFKKYINNKKYLKSEYPQKIKELKEIYIGKKCFIIGNGPSLVCEDLEKLKNNYTFSSNKIYNYFEKTTWRPLFYAAFDAEFLRENYKLVKDIKSKYVFLPYKVIKEKKGNAENIIVLNFNTKMLLKKYSKENIKFSKDISEFIGNGYTVTFVLIQIAIYMGFKEIYLIGIDNSYKNIIYSNNKIKTTGAKSHFYNDDSNFSNCQYLEGMEHAYQLAKDYADAHGIKIFNATRGGKLEIFERVNFDDIIKETEKDDL